MHPFLKVFMACLHDRKESQENSKRTNITRQSNYSAVHHTPMHKNCVRQFQKSCCASECLAIATRLSWCELAAMIRCQQWRLRVVEGLRAYHFRRRYEGLLALKVVGHHTALSPVFLPSNSIKIYNLIRFWLEPIWFYDRRRRYNICLRRYSKLSTPAYKLTTVPHNPCCGSEVLRAIATYSIYDVESKISYSTVLIVLILTVTTPFFFSFCCLHFYFEENFQRGLLSVFVSLFSHLCLRQSLFPFFFNFNFPSWYLVCFFFDVVVLRIHYVRVDGFNSIVPSLPFYCCMSNQSATTLVPKHN